MPGGRGVGARRQNASAASTEAGDRPVTELMGRITKRQNLPTFVAGVAVTAFVVFVAWNFWTPGQTIDTNKIILFLVSGVTLGSIYAIAASGLVVTYTTSGVFNFAQGAIGMLMAFIYWQLKVDWGVQTFIALVIVVLVVAPIFGAVIERVLMRRVADLSLVAQLVVTIGVMLALIGFVNLFWDPNESRVIGTFFGTDGKTIGDTFVPYYRMITIAAGVLIAIGIRLVLFRTRLGVAMRAVVDNRGLAALNGARPGCVSIFSWSLSSSMGALAGIFLAAETTTLSAQQLTLFIVSTFAAAIIGRLRSLPMTMVGGLIIGLALSFNANFMTLTDRWSTSGEAIPFIILFLALLFLPQARIEGRRVMSAITPRVPSMKVAALGFTVLVAVAVFLASVGLDRPDLRRVTLAVLTMFAMLSLVPLTGWSGQISLAQITFVGVGAWANLEFAKESTTSIFGVGLYHAGSPWGLLVAALVAVPFGLLMALPALRLQGLYLALASMAFALMAKPLFFEQPEVFGSAGRRVAPIEIFGYSFDQPFDFLGIHFGQDTGYLMLVAVLFAVFGLGVVGLRRSAFGRNLLAMKVAVFAVSAAIAGFAGALLSIHLGSAGIQDFEMLQGLPFLLLLVVGGVALVSGAVFGGTLLQVIMLLSDKFTWIVPVIEKDIFTIQQNIGPGLLGIGIGRQPEGVIPQVGHDVRERKRTKEAKRRAKQRGGPSAERPAAAPADQPVASSPASTPGA